MPPLFWLHFYKNCLKSKHLKTAIYFIFWQLVKFGKSYGTHMVVKENNCFSLGNTIVIHYTYFTY